MVSRVCVSTMLLDVGGSTVGRRRWLLRRHGFFAVATAADKQSQITTTTNRQQSQRYYDTPSTTTCSSHYIIIHISSRHWLNDRPTTTGSFVAPQPNVKPRIRDRQVAGLSITHCIVEYGLRQAAHAHLPLSPSSIICYIHR